MATLDDIRRIADTLPGSEERQRTGGATWLVRNQPYAWEVHPWPSIPDDVREIVANELIVSVKIASRMEADALFQMDPSVFLRTTTAWVEPKIAFRLAKIDRDHLEELIIEAWRVRAPKYLQREYDDARGNPPSLATEKLPE